MAPTPTTSNQPDSYQLDGIVRGWAKLGGALRSNELTDFTVKVTAVIGPDEIYIVKADAETVIDELNEKLNYYISERSYGGTAFADAYPAGAFVAAKDMENRWARAVILNEFYDEKGERRVDVSFIDHGDTRLGMDLADIFPLSSEFTTLECQAIALKLGHVEPTHPQGIWTKKVAKFMERILIRKGVTMRLDVVPLAKIGSGGSEDDMTPKCNWYEALVFTDMDHELGETLVRAKLARFKDEKAFLRKKTALFAQLETKVKKVVDQMLENDDERDDGLRQVGQLDEMMKRFDVFGFED